MPWRGPSKRARATLVPQTATTVSTSIITNVKKLAASVCGLAAAVHFTAANAWTQTNKQIFVTVVTNGGLPVTDLQPADFDVRESGLPRRILRAALANDPMRIALIVDSSETIDRALNQFRAGLAGFFDELPEGSEIALMTIGRQARQRLAPTADRKKLQEAAAGFFADGGGTAVLDGLIEGHSRYLRKAEARWPVVVLITTDGPATGSIRDDEFERLARELQVSGIVAHAIVVSTRGNGTPTVVALNVTQVTGGHYEAIAAATALPDKMKALGARLARQFAAARSQYRIEYVSETKDARGVDVGVTRAGVKLTVTNRR
jgi:hypothetical protein